MAARRWLAAWAALMVPVAAFGGASPEVIMAQPGVGDGAVERFTLRFNVAMVPLGDPRAAAPMKTDCAGQGRWVDQQTWVYEFAAPLDGAQKCSFEAVPGLKSVGGYTLTGQTKFEIDAGGPVVRSILPDAGGTQIEEEQTFLIATSVPALRQSIAANAYCAVEGIGEKIPVDVLPADVPARLLTAMSSSDYDAYYFLDKALVPFALLKPDAAMRFRQSAKLPAGDSAAARAKALANVVAVKCRRPLPPGQDVALVWSGRITGQSGKVAGADQRFDFKVRKPFTARFECSRINAAAGCNPVEPAYVRFSDKVPRAMAAAVRIRLPDGREIAPTLSKDEQHQATLSDVSFAKPLPFATKAEVILPANVRDESGRALTNAARFPLAVRFDSAPPLVKFAADFGILEAKQGGVLPVTVRAVEPALQGKRIGVGGRTLRVGSDDGEVARWLRTVDKAGEDDIDTVRNDDGEVIRSTNNTGARSILPAGIGEALSVPLPGKGRDFEVVGIPLGKPGFYVVELASPVLGRALLGRDAPRYVATAALVTNMAVHFKWGRERSLAWVTSLDTGRPVAGALVTITDSCTGAKLMHGTTDRSGGVLTAPGLPAPETYGSCEGENHPLMVSARAGDDFSFALTSWGDGIRPWDFELPYGYSAPGEQLHTVFDRTLLRQGETIHMKHILRQAVGAGFRIPVGFKGTLTLAHRGSDTRFELPLTIDGRGNGETSWTAPKGAPMGDYDLTVTVEGRTIASDQSFEVDEFRLPTMRATVTGPDRPAVVPKSLPLDLFVGYLSGGGAANLPVDLRVGWFRHSGTPEGYDNYSFGGRPVTEGVTALDNGGDDEASPLPPTQTLPATLGADGTARTSIDVPALDGLTDMRVEMDYQDADGEVLTASKLIPIHPSAVQLGIRTDGWLMKQDDLRLRFVALGLDGKPLKGRKINVALYSREVLTARRRLIGGFYAYDNQVRTTKLAQGCTATTDELGLATCRIDPGVSGEVFAVATTADDDGQVARAVTSTWLVGDDAWWFGGDNGDRMDVVPEKQSYAAGETARFQVRMPFRKATALVTVEREGVLSSFVTDLSGSDPVVEVKMPGSFAPDVYVSVMAVRGRIEPGWGGWFRRIAEKIGLVARSEPAPEQTALVDLAKPAYRLGIAKVKVGWEAHRLNVAVKAAQPAYGPRESAAVMVQVRAPDGKPAAAADVAFVAVDEALLQLSPNDSWDVLTALMGERPLSVLTATAQMQVVGKRHYGRKAVEAGGGGGDAAAALNRENFQPVLLWRGHLPLDAQGRAKVMVPLSDALSSFKLVAIATDGAQLYGTGSTSVRTRQDLSIYPGVPPLVRAGDWFAAGFTLRNGSAKPMTVTATAELSPRVAQGRPITVTIPAGGAVPVAWNLSVPAGLTNLRWQVSARAADGRAADRVTVTQDVVPAVPVEVWAQALMRVGADTQVPIAPPVGALAGRGSVDVRLADTLAPPMAGVREYMARYPYDCFEQQLSRQVVFDDLAGWRALSGEIPTYQAENGLLRYFPSPLIRGSEALTSYVLAVTAEAGWPLPEEPKRRMVQALTSVIDGRLRSEDYGDVRLQKLAAFTALARAGAATPAMIGQMGMAPAEMPTANLADYIVALDRLGAAPQRAQAEAVLRSRLVYEGTRLDLTDAGSTAWWLMQSGDEAAIKAASVAVGRPGWQDEAPKMMVGVASRQQRGHWDTTPANAWGALLVRRFAAAYPAQAIQGTTTLSLAGRQVAKGWPLAEAKVVASFALPSGQTPLLLRQAGGDGPWATVSVKAAVPLRQPLFAGYRLTKQVTVVQARVPGRFTRGDVLRVTLTVEASAERSWVVVSDPVPPGATIVGALGGQSAMLAEGGPQDASAPSYVERGREAWRGYFAWMPRGKTVMSYTVRLNGAGRFSLPPSVVEAMYSPAIRAAVPNAAVTVGQR
ncbi:hypothetical protein GGQ80_001559 [Sphingomonas jinjuensis]|uniref:Alpha-2-macroglobulin n=1 Tax=Sphingomonas jinjuensis TaxID=535907 RepID=A0A840F2S9_9SPHN|nr:MG2 domain-containing protein [Sphingomonas jinjuensis]MBB4153653.1 hypothetical protein [Sphingomonas jinjuensis]